jgi:4'-phosphopantetheinyl transferase
VIEGPSASADVWFAWVGEHARDVDRFTREFLSTDETQRMGRYRSREAAERYVVTRSLVRIVLGEHLGVSPRALHVSRTDTGKPVVAEGINFNVTHSGDLVLLAVCEQRAVGVDVERQREVPRVGEMMLRWFSEAERQECAHLTTLGATQSEAFLRVWSLKEARLKALGVGISGAAGAPLEGVDVRSLAPLLESLTTQHAAPSYVGALAFA